MKSKSRYAISFLDRPGRTLDDRQLEALVTELREVAATCFDELPSYQCLEGSRAELSDKVITLARRRDGVLAGFCSSVLLPVEGVGDVLHLGLTCVRPEDRGMRLTHQLTVKLVLTYYGQHVLLGKLWISNVACVLSSLGNVALGFDAVYPSPFGARAPSARHLAIAAAIDRHFRNKVAVNADAVFDLDAFVFRRSVDGTVFVKEAQDPRFHHRLSELNRFYSGILHFEEGDEVLQVGCVSALTLFKHAARRIGRRWTRGLRPVEPVTSAR